MSMSRAITIASLFLSLALHGAALFIDSKNRQPITVMSRQGSAEAISIKLAAKPKVQKPTVNPRKQAAKPAPITEEIPLEISQDYIEETTYVVEEHDDAPTHFAPQPQYPRIAQLRGHEGFVRVRLAINGQGEPLSAELVESSGYQSLDQAALRGLMLWRFHATHGTQALGYWTEKLVEFRLQ
jgi:periplasmic protein TonB